MRFFRQLPPRVILIVLMLVLLAGIVAAHWVDGP